jgi:adenylate kinase
MLRAAVKEGTPLGEKAKDLMDRGELLGDDLIMEMVAGRLSESDVRARGFVLDGCPRTVGQAVRLAEVLEPLDLDVAIDIEIATPVVIRRLAARRVCVDCGANYSTSNPPLINWSCDVCGGEVVQREDDTEEAISRRLELYERQTAPLIAWYEERAQLAKVSGNGRPDDVTRRIVRAVEQRRQRRMPR